MARNPDRGRNLAIGCFMLPLGAASGAMTGVLVSTIVAWATRAQACPEVPACNWYIFAGWGALVGVLTLPVLVSWRLFQSAPRRELPTDTNRS